MHTRILSLTMALTLATSLGLLAKKDPEVQIWNKKESGIDMWEFRPKDPRSEPWAKLFEKIEPGSDRAYENAANIDLYIKLGEKPKEGDMVQRMTFTPGKTVYVRLGKGRKFGPQTGPLKGWKGVTESGFSLKNNVKKEDIERTKVYVRDSAAEQEQGRQAQRRRIVREEQEYEAAKRDYAQQDRIADSVSLPWSMREAALERMRLIEKKYPDISEAYLPPSRY